MKLLFFLHLLLCCHKMFAMNDSKQIIVFHEDSTPPQAHENIIVNINMPKSSPDAKTTAAKMAIAKADQLVRTATESSDVSGKNKLRIAMIGGCVSVLGLIVTLVIHLTDC